MLDYGFKSVKSDQIPNPKVSFSNALMIEGRKMSWLTG